MSSDQLLEMHDLNNPIVNTQSQSEVFIKTEYVQTDSTDLKNTKSEEDEEQLNNDILEQIKLLEYSDNDTNNDYIQRLNSKTLHKSTLHKDSIQKRKAQPFTVNYDADQPIQKSKDKKCKYADACTLTYTPSKTSNHGIIEDINDTEEEIKMLEKKQFDDLCSIKVNAKKNKILIPMFMTFLMKKLVWAEKNQKFTVSGTFIMRTFTKDLFRSLKIIQNAKEITNKEDIIKELTNQNIRVNDTEPIPLEGPNKLLNIQNGKLFVNESFIKNHEKKLKSISGSQTDEFDGENDPFGYATTCRKIIEDIHFDTNTAMSDFPQNQCDVMLKLEMEAKIIDIVCEMEDGSEKTFSREFGYILQDSIIPTNVFSAKFKEVDQLDTHDPFFNQLGYRYKISDESKIEYYCSLRHEPGFTYQFTLMPMQLLQLFQIVICLYGESADKLANLITVQIAYGAFAIVAASDTILSKDKNICDIIQTTSLSVSVVQFAEIVIDGLFDSHDLSYFEWFHEIIDNLVIAISILVFICSTIFYNQSQLTYKRRMIAGLKSHDSIIKLTQNYIKEQIKQNLNLHTSQWQKFLNLFKSKKTNEVETKWKYTGEFRNKIKPTFMDTYGITALSSSFMLKMGDLISIFLVNLEDFIYQVNVLEVYDWMFSNQYTVQSRASSAKGGDKVNVQEWRKPMCKEMMGDLDLSINSIFNHEDGYSYHQLMNKDKIDMQPLEGLTNLQDYIKKQEKKKE